MGLAHLPPGEKNGGRYQHCGFAGAREGLHLPSEPCQAGGSAPGLGSPLLDSATGFPAGSCSADASSRHIGTARFFPWEKAVPTGPGAEGAAAPWGTCGFLRVQSKGILRETREALRQAAVFGDPRGSGI